MKKFLSAMLIVILIVSVCGCEKTCEHEWAEATCTTAQTCLMCGEIQGEVLEHEFSDATCEEAKKCSRCAETEGKALGHSVYEWNTIQDSTCSEPGIKEGVCKRCEEVINDEVEFKEHEPGGWVVTKSATETNQGVQVKNCNVCGIEVDKEFFKLTEEEIKQRYINKCETYSYNNIARSPNEYKGKYAKIYGKVLQVMQEKSGGKISYTLRIGTGGSYYYDKVILASYTASEDEPRILEDDMITAYGMLGGEYTYETVMGNEITLPLMFIEYVK